tara:strand:- start:50 stop:649 length:600 start_codon:yes stop_codon:yes gene_type:complete
MPRLTREESKIRTKKMLLEAAKSDFARQGYGNTTADSIAEKAGFSKGAFYANFDSKEEIFLELLKIHMHTESEVFRGLFKTARNIEEILEGIDKWFLAMQNDAEWQLLSVELNLHAKRHPEFASKFYKLQSAHQEVLCDFVKLFFELAKKKPVVSYDLIAYYIMSMSLGIAVMKHPSPKKQQINGQIVILFLNGLLSQS